jgi:hypothetical protein
MNFFLAYLKSSLLFWVVLAVAVAGFVLLVYFARQYALYAELSESGIRTSAEVTDVSRYHNNTARSIPIIHLRYSDGEGNEHQDWIQPRSSAYSVGERVDVTFSRDDPSRFLLTGELGSGKVQREKLIMTGVGAVMCLPAFLTLLRLASRARMVDRVFSARGQAQGRVLALHESDFRIGRRKRYVLEYEYTGPLGNRLTGRSDMIPAKSLDRFAPDSPVTVYYNRSNPEESAVDVWGWLSRSP